MSALWVPVIWCLLPGHRGVAALAALASVMHILWLPAIWILGRWIAAQRLRRANQEQLRQLDTHGVEWLEHLQIQSAAGLNLSDAMLAATQGFCHVYPHLDGYLPSPQWDLAQQCSRLEASPCRLWSHAGKGLIRLNQQGANPSVWLADLIDQHHLRMDEARQSAAASLGSKLLMPLIVGALPQAFGLIGFVVMQTSEGL